MIFKQITLLLLFTCAGCSQNSPIAPADPRSVFALRTECGKMGEAWLMRHPLEVANNVSYSAANIFYSSSANRCWIVVSYSNWHYSKYIGRGPRLWPVWANHDIRKDVTEEKQYLYDIQTGAKIMMCRTLDYSFGYDDDCRYIKKVEVSDL